MQRIFTRPPLAQRIRRHPAFFPVAALLFIVAALFTAELLCTAAGVSYDARIEVAA